MEKDRVPVRRFATEMRLQPTRCEMMMYNALLAAFHPYCATVRPQEPIGPYIADFFIAPCNVVVEVDGPCHSSAEAKAHDKRRNSFMASRGLTVFRLQNRQVERSASACAQFVLNKCLPLKTRDLHMKVTYCPSGSAFPKRSKATKNLFWRG